MLAAALAAGQKLFQSPLGDSLFSDLNLDIAKTRAYIFCFNPLAGIRCFLTLSPERTCVGTAVPPVRFNPLAGIRCFLTLQKIRRGPHQGNVSIP